MIVFGQQVAPLPPGPRGPGFSSTTLLLLKLERKARVIAVIDEEKDEGETA